jgi:hypothetical protein
VSESEFCEDLAMLPQDARYLTKCVEFWKSTGY